MKKLFPLLLLSLSACELIVDVDVPNEGDKVVVNAMQYTDSTWHVQLSLTSYILHEGYGTLWTNPANVTIQYPDGSTEALVNVSGAFSNEFRGTGYPQPGQKYKITVNPQGFESVQAEMVMPNIVKIDNIVWDSSQVAPQAGPFGYSDVPLKLTFTDPAGVDNFYAAEVWVHALYTSVDYFTKEESTDTLVRAVSLWIEEDPAIAAEDDRVSRYSDRTFAGRQYTASYTTQFVIQPNMAVYRIEVRLLSISEETFKYEQTKQLQNDVMGDPFAQPVPVYSNFNNGVGIFGGNAFDVRVYPR